jgi:hypothetical protein
METMVCKIILLLLEEKVPDRTARLYTVLIIKNVTRNNMPSERIETRMAKKTVEIIRFLRFSRFLKFSLLFKIYV